MRFCVTKHCACSPIGRLPLARTHTFSFSKFLANSKISKISENSKNIETIIFYIFEKVCAHPVRDPRPENARQKTAIATGADAEGALGGGGGRKERHWGAGDGRCHQIKSRKQYVRNMVFRGKIIRNTSKTPFGDNIYLRLYLRHLPGGLRRRGREMREDYLSTPIPPLSPYRPPERSGRCNGTSFRGWLTL